MKSGFLRKAKNLIGPVLAGPIKVAADHSARPAAPALASEAVPRADASSVQARRILEARLRSVTASAPDGRVQKNLSIARHDAERMTGLARRDGVSQARLLAAALDCYEAAYGPLTSEGG